MFSISGRLQYIRTTTSPVLDYLFSDSPMSATSNLSKKTLQINFRLYLGVFRGFKKREDFFVNCGERSGLVSLNKTRLPDIRLKGAFNE